MRIREAEYKDAHNMGTVHVDTWRSTYRGIVPDAYLDSLSHESAETKWRQRLASPELLRFHLVAEDDDGRVVGIVEAGLNEDEKFPEYEAQVYTLYILRQFQHRGIGRMLIHETVRRLLEMDIESMLIWVVSQNPSRGFYEHLGGRFLGTNVLHIHGWDVEESAYGWDDLSAILEGELLVG